MEKKPSWACTLATQVSLCLAAYLALNLGSEKPYHQTGVDGNKSSRRPLDIYFMTVTAGVRSVEQQTHLLQQMENVARAYEVKFLVYISELGENDPLLQNATSHSQLQKIPWYTTRVSKGQQAGCFTEEIKLPHGRSLNIIGVDTGSLQDLVHWGSSSDIGNKQLNWLTRRLEATTSNWCLVVGFHPLFSCEDDIQMKPELHNGPLHHVFVRYGVNAYISGQGCTSYTFRDGVAYISNPVLSGKDPHLALNGRSDDLRKMANGFLLHRVSSLEIVTYSVTSAQEIVHKSVVQQRGKEIM